MKTVAEIEAKIDKYFGMALKLKYDDLFALCWMLGNIFYQACVDMNGRCTKGDMEEFFGLVNDIRKARKKNNLYKQITTMELPNESED